MLQDWLFGLIAPLCVVIFTVLAWVYYGRAEAKKLAWQAAFWTWALKAGETEEIARLFYSFLPPLARRGLPTFKKLALQSLDKFERDYATHKIEVKASLIIAKRGKDVG